MPHRRRTRAPQVSADGEMRLYEACSQAGITLLSIAHRPSLKRFHQLVVHFDGAASGSKGWWLEDPRQEQRQPSTSSAAAAGGAGAPAGGATHLAVAS